MMTNESLTKYISLHPHQMIEFSRVTLAKLKWAVAWEWGHRHTGYSRKTTLTVILHTYGRKGNSATMTLPDSAALCDVIYETIFYRCEYSSLHLSHRLLKLNTDSDCGPEALLHASRDSIPPTSLCTHGPQAKKLRQSRTTQYFEKAAEDCYEQLVRSKQWTSGLELSCINSLPY